MGRKSPRIKMVLLSIPVILLLAGLFLILSPDRGPPPPPVTPLTPISSTGDESGTPRQPNGEPAVAVGTDPAEEERRVIAGSFSATLVGPIGEPVANARLIALVYWNPDWPYRHPESRSGQNGEIRLDVLSPGRLQLLATAMGYAPAIFTGDDFMIREGETTAVGELRLVRGCDAGGTVVDSEGEPIPGVEVSAECIYEHISMVDGARPPPLQVKDLPLYSPKTRTDVQGRFAFKDLPVHEWPLRFEKSGYFPKTEKTPSHGKEFTVTLLKGAVVDVRLTRSDGAPLGEYTMWQLLPGKEWARAYMMSGNLDGMPAGGLFEPGATSLMFVTKDGLVSPILTVELGQGETFGPSTLTLEPGGCLSGRILTPDGKGMMRARVRAVPIGGPGVPLPMLECISGSSGTYRLPSVPPGDYDLLVTSGAWAGGVVRSLRVGSGETVETDLHLTRGGWLDLLVTVGGEPVKGARVTLGSEAPLPLFGTWPQLTNAKGSYQSTLLPPGWLEVKVVLPGGETRFERVEIILGKRRAMTLAF